MEVEAVKFLKEEPHRLDALLKRCKTITDTLATMRKYEPALTESARNFVLLLFSLESMLCSYRPVLTDAEKFQTNFRKKFVKRDFFS